MQGEFIMPPINIDDNYVIKPPKIIYIIFIIFFGFLNVLFLLVFLKNNSIWQPFLIVVGISLFVLYYISKHRITIKDGLCSVSRPFFNTRTIQLERLLYINVIPAFEERGSKFKPPFRIALGFNEDKNGIKEIILNAKMFEVKNLDILSRTIEKNKLKGIK